VNAALIELLVCPHDHTSLRPDDEAAADHDRAPDARLTCEEGHSFVVSSGVPFILPHAHAGGDDQSGTAETFGAKWATFRDEDREAVLAFQYSWYDQRYGWDGEGALADFLADKRRILDAGCGLGRDVARYARLSEAEVVGFDLSNSVIRARRDLGMVPRAHFVRADILAPPFRAGSFDFVIADQVIHHTPDCARAFRTLASLVGPGGQLAAYVYRRKGLVRELADTHVRELTTKMTIEECTEFSEQITELGRELSHLQGTIHLESGIPLLGIAPGEHDVQHLIYWHFLKCFWNDDLGPDQSILTNFDWYHPPYASRHTPEEVEAWCQEAGLRIVHLNVIESGISVRAERPC
jgi:SAM-dependent methyltransferase/uncharacterized protein YbaR (Trm112 family)